MSDTTVVKTEYGDIQIDTYAIGSLIVKIADHYRGRLHLTSRKGRRVAWLYRFTDAAEIDNMVLDFDEEGRISIKVYVMILFGVSISGITQDFLDKIEEAVELALGQKPRRTTVVVTGLLSKQVARRNIQVTRCHEEAPES